jgi:hypothetical protein
MSTNVFSLLCLILLEGDAFVEGLGAFVAFWEEMDADATNMFLGLEIFEVVGFVSFLILYLITHF